MNKSYKSVWNESTGTWVAVSELATGRSKSKRAKTALSKAILTQMAVGGLSVTGMSAAMASDDQVVIGKGAAVSVLNGIAIGTDATVDTETDTIHFPGAQNGGLAIGNGSYVTGSGVAVGENAQASSQSLAFGYGAQAIAGSSAIGRNARAFNSLAVALGENASASGVGSLAVGANTKTSGDNNVALGQGSVADRGNTVSVGSAGNERQIVNVGAGVAKTDAVNVQQLSDAGLNIDTSGHATNSFVAYDNTTKNLVTLGGTAGTTLSNVKAGVAKTDAVNVQQLTDAGLNIDTSGHATNSFVAYDGSAKDKVTLGGGANGTTVSNVKAGVANSDAVAVSQLKSAGFALDATGNVTNQAVTFTAGTIESGSPAITLAPGQGDSAYFKNGDRRQGLLPQGTVISNVGNGVQDTDAANVGQVYDIMNQTGGDGVQGVQNVKGVRLLQAGASGSGVNTTGLTTAYKTAAYYSQVSGLADSSGSTPPSDVARADGAGSIAIGSNAYSKAASSTSIGVQAYSSASDAVALGSGSVANVANTVSVGSDGTGSYTAYDAKGTAYTIQNQANTRRITNMASGHSGAHTELLIQQGVQIALHN
jgi:trimeric autotransporter adhesin